MSEQTPLKGGNPGFAGELGDFNKLTEPDVRGSAFAKLPKEGGIGGGVCAYPYQLAERHPDAKLFEGPYRQRVQKIIARYPEKQGALLPLLNLSQEIQGYVSPEAMEIVAKELELSPAYVRGVATFYSMYNRRPVGTWFIQVCTNVACNICGADDVMRAFCDGTATEPGQVTKDGLFTVMEAECLGACGFPTAVQINERYFENVMPEDVPAILDRLRKEAPKNDPRKAVPEEILATVDVAGNGKH